MGFEPNEGPVDRGIRAVVGVILLLVGFSFQGVLAWIFYILAAVSLITALTGWCGLYKVLGISTVKIREGVIKNPLKSAAKNRPAKKKAKKASKKRK